MNRPEIRQFISEQIVRSSERLQRFVKDRQGKDYPKRELATRLLSHAERFISGKSDIRWVVVPGLRGVGKTTALAQVYMDLSKSTANFQGVFLSMQDIKSLFGGTMLDVINEYEGILGEGYERREKPLFLFLDEVQDDPNWNASLISLWNRNPHIFIFASGSSAIALQTTADSARRSVIEKAYPLSFTEYQMIKRGIPPPETVTNCIKDALFYSATAEAAYGALVGVQQDVDAYWSHVDRLDVQEYLDIGTLPFALRYNDRAKVYQAVLQMLDKVIMGDLPQLGRFDIQTLLAVKRLLALFAEGGPYSYQKLKSILGLSPEVIANLLDVLELSELLVKVPAHGSVISKATKSAKYYFMTSAIRAAFYDIFGRRDALLTSQGALLEDVAAMIFHREFVFPRSGTVTRDGAEGGADFVLQIANDRQIAVEVGMGQKKIDQVERTMKRIKCDYGIVFGDTVLAKHHAAEIIKVPLEFLYLL